MSPEVETRFKESDACECGCGKRGVLKKAWRSNDQRCVRGCECRQCVGGKVKDRARRREHTVARGNHGQRNPGSGAFGGLDGIGGVCSWEETANVAIIAGLKRWWLAKGTQGKVAKLLADTLRPRAFVASWDGRPRLVVMPYEDWCALIDLADPEEAA